MKRNFARNVQHLCHGASGDGPITIRQIWTNRNHGPVTTQTHRKIDAATALKHRMHSCKKNPYVCFVDRSNLYKFTLSSMSENYSRNSFHDTPTSDAYMSWLFKTFTHLLACSQNVDLATCQHDCFWNIHANLIFNFKTLDWSFFLTKVETVFVQWFFPMNIEKSKYWLCRARINLIENWHNFPCH